MRCRTLLHAHEGAPALARRRVERRQVVGAVAQDRERLLGERRDDELALLAVLERLPGRRVDDLEEQMVLVDVQAAGALALTGDAWAHHLGEPVVVGGADAEPRLDLGLHLVGTRLAAEQPEPELERREVDPELLALPGEEERVRRRGHQDRGAEVLHHAQVALGAPGAGGDDGRADAFDAVVQAPSAGGHAVGERHLHEVAALHAGRGGDASGQLRPRVDVAARVADHDRLARRARGRVHAHDLVERQGEHAEGGRLPQGALVGERQTAHVVEAADVARPHPRLVHAGAVVRAAFVRPRGRHLEAAQLQFLQRRPVHALVLGVPDHGPSPSPRHVPR